MLRRNVLVVGLERAVDPGHVLLQEGAAPGQVWLLLEEKRIPYRVEKLSLNAYGYTSPERSGVVN